MKRFLQIRGAAVCSLIVLSLVLLGTSVLKSQSKYRTFSQQALSEKKGRPGRSLGSNVCFTFTNEDRFPRYGFHAIVGAKILAVLDSGGFPTLNVLSNYRIIEASGLFIDTGKSATICLLVQSKEPGTKVNFWWWSSAANPHIIPTHTKLEASSDIQLFTQPNGGNVREYIYRKIITRPAGIILGIPRPDSAKSYGWVRFKTPDRKYFPDTGRARCFDYIMKSSGLTKAFHGELKNPHVKKHDNRLLGEVHALRLAVIANDARVTEPLDESSTRLGDLIYNDAGNPDDPYNGLTIRQILAKADSALTFCSLFTPDEYNELHATIAKINQAFDGDYNALSFEPFLLAGTHSLGEVPWLLPNPTASPSGMAQVNASIIDEEPEGFELRQNYPNPFNPTTTIEFNLGDDPVIATLKVYNMIGQEVATLINEEELDGGEQIVDFNAGPLASGIYVYKITAKSLGEEPQFYQETKKMMLLR
ncbi:MAG TPA: T9SS type A sorting domain-containing protein [Bacteroidota bacterium]|nr:T9SS type A sorting domain-containing protein [Bacteroidota bacterium]